MYLKYIIIICLHIQWILMKYWICSAYSLFEFLMIKKNVKKVNKKKIYFRKFKKKKILIDIFLHEILNKNIMEKRAIFLTRWSEWTPRGASSSVDACDAVVQMLMHPVLIIYTTTRWRRWRGVPNPVGLPYYLTFRVLATLKHSRLSLWPYYLFLSIRERNPSRIPLGK